jgi:hypothetical protein
VGGKGGGGRVGGGEELASLTRHSRGCGEGWPANGTSVGRVRGCGRVGACECGVAVWGRRVSVSARGRWRRKGEGGFARLAEGAHRGVGVRRGFHLDGDVHVAAVAPLHPAIVHHPLRLKIFLGERIGWLSVELLLSAILPIVAHYGRSGINDEANVEKQRTWFAGQWLQDTPTEEKSWDMRHNCYTVKAVIMKKLEVTRGSGAGHDLNARKEILQVCWRYCRGQRQVP